MFERFTREARRAVLTAVEEAERRGDPHISTEHLLLGVLTSELPFEPSVLGPLGLPVDDLRGLLHGLDAHALDAVGIDPELAVMAAVPGAGYGRRHRRFTGGARRILVEALRQAVARGDRRLGPQHLLLALLSVEAPDPAALAIDRLGVDRVTTRSAVLGALRRAS